MMKTTTSGSVKVDVLVYNELQHCRVYTRAASFVVVDSVTMTILQKNFFFIARKH